jgi:hypothetical protein
MAYEELKSSGITAKTPKNILLGAGTIHKGLTFEGGKWNFEESLLGATAGGTKLSIVPEIKQVEVDGANVKVKGLTVKVGETATIETNMVELTPDWIKMSVIGKTGESAYEGYDEIVSKRQFEDGDYINNFAYVGKYIDGRPVIIVFDYALCSTGLEVEGKNKENGVFKATFECYAELSSEADILPYHIYTPKVTV